MLSPQEAAAAAAAAGLQPSPPTWAHRRAHELVTAVAAAWLAAALRGWAAAAVNSRHLSPTRPGYGQAEVAARLQPIMAALRGHQSTYWQRQQVSRAGSGGKPACVLAQVHPLPGLSGMGPRHWRRE